MPCCTNSKPHNTDGTPHNFSSDQQSVCPTCCPVALTVSPTIQSAHRTLNGWLCDEDRRGFKLILKFKLLYRHFIRKSELLFPNELKCLIIYFMWIFTLCVWDIFKRHLFLSQTTSTFLTTLRSHSVNNSKSSTSVLTAVPSAVVTLKLAIIKLMLICLQ